MSRKNWAITETEFKPWEEVFSEFLKMKKLNGLAERTLHDYVYVINRFFRENPKVWETPSFLRDSVIRFLSQDGISSATYNIRYRNLRCFFNWCLEEHYLEADPLRGIRSKRNSSRIVDISNDIIKKLLSLPDTTTYTGLRDYCLILLQLDCGIRPGEALQLKVRDFNPEKNQIAIPSGVAKTRNNKIVPLSNETAKAIKKLIRNRLPDWINDNPLFCNCEGKLMLVITWSHKLEKYSTAIGFTVKPYDLRHQFAVMYLRSGGNSFALHKILSHTSMQMTKHYVSLTEVDLLQAHEKASPINSLVDGQVKRAK